MEPKQQQKGGNAAAAQTPPSSQPRDYTVFRELTLGDLIGDAKLGEYAAKTGITKATPVLIELDTISAKTPREARRTVAKAKFGEDELKQGVPLRAITKSAATAGRGVAKIKVDPSWDD